VTPKKLCGSATVRFTYYKNWSMHLVYRICKTEVRHFSKPTYYYASAQCSMAGGIMVLSCLSVRLPERASVCAFRNTVNTIFCGVFDTFSPNLYTNDILWNRDECVKFCGKRSQFKVTVE